MAVESVYDEVIVPTVTLYDWFRLSKPSAMSPNCWIMFSNARVAIGDGELAWAAAQPVGHHLVPELYIRELTASPQLHILRDGEEVRLVFAARSFLHRQVRSMTGSLAEVGTGRWTPDDLAAALAARDRAACGPVAPADGLYLAGVDY